MDNPFIIKIIEKCRETNHSVAAFNFPYLDRGEGHSSGPQLLEELDSLKEVLDFCKGEKYQQIRLIGKSLGGIVASYFLKTLSENELKKYSVVVLGYVLGPGGIDLKSYPGNITIIQGENDKFGNVAAVKKDLENAVSKAITFIEIPAADHSYHGFEDQAITAIPNF